MEVVTFSGVTSGGIVTSGTTGWTCFAHQLHGPLIRTMIRPQGIEI